MARYTRAKIDEIAGQPGGETAVPASESMIANRGSLIVMAFLISLAMPVFFKLGFVRMSPYRVILLALIIPLFIGWAQGACGRKRATDYLVILYASWTMIASIANHGVDAIEFGGIFVIESLGPYLLARRYIRNLGDFLRATKVLFGLMLLFLPFAFLEATTAKLIYAPFFKFMGTTISYAGYDPRLGLDRVQVAFDHPILYGVFCSTTFAFLFYTPRKNGERVSGLTRAWASIAATFFSLSSGAYIPILFQSGLMFYNWVMRSVANRWKLMAWGIAIFYVAIDLGSNRTPSQVFGSLLAFSSSTYYYRVLIFEFGIQNVWANPVFGFGLTDGWARPTWMVTSTIDHFWLVIAIRYGIPGFLFFTAAYITSIIALVRVNVVTTAANNQRLALVFVLLSTGIAITTVFLWNATYVYLMFLLGAGGWLESDGAQAAKTPAVTRGRPKARDADAGDLPEQAAVKVSERRKYSRVKPRRADDKPDQSQADQGH